LAKIEISQSEEHAARDNGGYCYAYDPAKDGRLGERFHGSALFTRLAIVVLSAFRKLARAVCMVCDFGQSLIERGMCPAIDSRH